MRLQKPAYRPDLPPQFPPVLPIPGHGQRLPQLHRERGGQVRGAPDRALGPRGERVEVQSVPAVQCRDAVREPEEEFREIGRVARGVL